MGTLLPATAASATSPDHHNKMASILPVIVLLCGLCIGANVAQNAVCTCPAGWSQFGDSCYIFQSAGRDWATAERACTNLGGILLPSNPKECTPSSGSSLSQKLANIKQLGLEATMRQRRVCGCGVMAALLTSRAGAAGSLTMLEMRIAWR